MGFKAVNQKEVSKYLKNQITKIETVLIRELEYFVAELENHAKLSAGYEDQTSNLKSSIGGVVLKNGKPISYAGFRNEGQADEGAGTGMAYINELMANYTRGYVILVVAGMNYASYVEDFHGRNVLRQTELKMRRELPAVIQNIIKRI